MLSQKRSAFTLVEVLVAVVLLGVGITAVFGAYSSLSQAENRAREVEKMQRLAVDKLSELKATTDQFSAGDNGDFNDRGESDLVWTLEVEPSGVENLYAVTLRVERKNGTDSSPQAQVTQLVFEQPTDTGGTSG